MKLINVNEYDYTKASQRTQDVQDFFYVYYKITFFLRIFKEFYRIPWYILL